MFVVQYGRPFKNEQATKTPVTISYFQYLSVFIYIYINLYIFGVSPKSSKVNRFSSRAQDSLRYSLESESSNNSFLIKYSRNL